MEPKNLKLFENNKIKYRIKETGEIINSEKIEKIILIYQKRLKKISEIGELVDFFFKNKLKYNRELLKWKNMPDKELIISIDKLENILSKIENKEWKTESIKDKLLEDPDIVENKGKFLWPLRTILSGKESSAPPFEIAEIIGKEKTLRRIKEAREFIKNN